jgi:hypothetical protein
MKYLGINLTKEAKDFYNENYKPLKNEIKENMRRWKDFLHSWIDRINTVKMAISLKTIYMFSTILFKIPMTFHTEIEKSILSSYGNTIDLK